jgi:ribulose 1,5-bisphosphate carboxylase large subunit-like protein
MTLSPEQLERVQYLAEDRYVDPADDVAASWAEFDRVLPVMSGDELHALVEQMNWDGGEDAAARLNRVLAHPRGATGGRRS